MSIKYYFHVLRFDIQRVQIILFDDFDTYPIIFLGSNSWRTSGGFLEERAVPAMVDAVFVGTARACVVNGLV